MCKPNQHINLFIGYQTVSHSTQQVKVQNPQQVNVQNDQQTTQYIYISHYYF